MQLRMLVINLIYMMCSTLVTIAVILFPIIALMQQSPFMEVQYHASRFFLVIAERVPLVMVVFCILFFIYHIVMTRKVCGPLENFSTTFHRLMQGDLTRKVHLRKSDYLKQEAKDINEMIDALAHALTLIREENDALRRVLKHISLKTADGEERQSSEQALQAALQQSEKINHLVAQFKIDRTADGDPSGK
jgi:methyl-accepting chemotaxis protein